ncbi:MAG TPA: dihydrodipicolinate reductase C-terminal domain-containing protein [Vicinamibacterales bacterium]|nr:dihydrodipicolinate reductase C-terminal domain-containing protein [Vicinamibacterales bacterium]
MIDRNLATPHDAAPRVLIVGYGRMGRLVESLCAEHGMVVAGIVDRRSSGWPDAWPEADVAIDFSTADAVGVNAPRLAAKGINLVIGTTGWNANEPAIRQTVADHQVGAVAAPNFALGVNLFVALVERAGALMRSRRSFGAWIHELHHAAKRDAPSGTALALLAALREGGVATPVDVASTRAGCIPGTHTVGFDAAGETITLTHAARDRTGFARGALEAARWVIGRRGWFTMRDVLGIHVDRLVEHSAALAAPQGESTCVSPGQDVARRW